MFSLSRPLIVALTGFACVCASRPAAAWIETSVLSDAVVVEVDKQGQAIVSHDLWMKIRGGPLKGTELDGIDSDAEPLPDAQVAKMTASGGAEQTKPLLLSRGDDDTLRIEVDDGVGLRNGTYAFRFKYRTDLRQRSRIGLRGSWAELAWVGPRYRAGLDVAKVTFKLAYAATAPRLPEIDPSIEELAQGELPTAAMLSTLRRGSDLDELELVRPHVAKGEPVLWRIWAAPTGFTWLSESKREHAATLVPMAVTPRAPLGKGFPLVLAAVLALITAVVVQLKHRAVAEAAAQQNCRPRPLIAMGPHWRAAAAGLLLAIALLLCVRFDAPSSGALVMLLALACMTYRRPVWPRALRGPGRWLPVHQSEAFAREVVKVPGRVLDLSTLPGKCALLAWVALMTSSGLWLFRSQPYLALLTFMAIVVPWPILLTGRFSELPLVHRDRSRRKLESLYRRLARDQRLRIHPVGRFSDGDSEPDEVRLKVSAASMPQGMLGLEIASHGIDGMSQLCLLIRVRDGSEAHQHFQAMGAYTRGRTPEERVSIFAPTLAARERILARVRMMLDARAASGANYGAPPPRVRNSSAKSSGSGSSTSKPGKAPPPDQATRAA